MKAIISHRTGWAWVGICGLCMTGSLACTFDPHDLGLIPSKDQGVGGSGPMGNPEVPASTGGQSSQPPKGTGGSAPVVDPDAGVPPTGQPPVVDPDAGVPPTGQPPVVDPDAGVPPTGQPPTSGDDGGLPGTP
jgi:hypothetical protein